MPNLTIHLEKITNLRNGGMPGDIADPYVKFKLKQDNFGPFNDDKFGKMESSRKEDENDPVFNETFVFEDIPRHTKNLVLTAKIMDENKFRDTNLGSCEINLDKLDLDPIPTLVRKQITHPVFGEPAIIFLSISYGQKAWDADAVDLSHVGQAAYECMRTKYAQYHNQLWNVTRGRVVGELHQTPKNAFPGPSENFEDGHDDWFPEIMGDILSRTKVWADVLSLSAPTGKFVTAFQGALAKIAENAAGNDKPVIIRMMFGNIVGAPTNCDAIRDELTEGLPKSAKIQLWVGAWRRGVSWNHAKIIAVDGKHLHTGGHNMWDEHYLTHDPVHDLSLEMEGDVAYDGHLFANRQWDFIESRQETFWGTIGSKTPDWMPAVALVRVIVSEWPKEEAAEHAPKFKTHLVKSVAEADGPLEDTIPIITMGRYGALTAKDRPSDDAFLAMLGSAQTIIHLALQDLGPVCIPNSSIPLPGTMWPKPYLDVLAKVLWERGVDVEIVVSNPAATPGGLNPMTACYGNGWSCVDVAAEIIKRIRVLYPNAEDDELRKKVRDNLRVAFIREERGSTWENGMNVGMHAKHFIVDDVATYIGSQNLYVCDLAEWGVVIDDVEQTKKFMDEYWNPLWKYSNLGQDIDVDAVMDSLDIDRDGAEATSLSDKMKAQMKAAELRSHGVIGSGLTEEDEA
eukprot:CAMPEP_0194290114 /NCGR_PEP_ID=MMETSP0169-20130528/40589_1 /TAXON_ID=218684 /ORGANISM="Corethron pennatum, Strain L29A3" /LENGTH=681 /DNA_ID=CAMNT_0039037623 /DNA_START=52 /DNA_END=2097 /DNA_ORIENTATION=+